jgi:hypothetical protein
MPMAARFRRANHLKQLNTEQATYSNDEGDGSYRLSSLPPGLYELRVEARGFQTVVYQNLSAAAARRCAATFQLKPAQVAEQVVIEASANETQVDTMRTVIGGTLTRAQIDELPVESRNVLDLVYLLPGIASPAFTDRDLGRGR